MNTRSRVRWLQRPTAGSRPAPVLSRKYRDERHTVTVVPEGFVWWDVTRKSIEHNLDLEFNSLADLHQVA